MGLIEVFEAVESERLPLKAASLGRERVCEFRWRKTHAECFQVQPMFLAYEQVLGVAFVCIQRLYGLVQAHGSQREATVADKVVEIWPRRADVVPI